MSKVTKAYVCNAAGEDLKLQDITLPPLKESMVEIDMRGCGLCRTDIHMKDNDWGVSNFPLVVGHEGVGIVRQVGSIVRNVKIGDLVGVGWIRDSCRGCNACLCGRENLCEQGYQGTFLGPSAGCWGKDPHNEHGGCFSQVMRVEERFVVKIPKSIPWEVAAPLLCAGATVFEPVVNFVTPDTKVAVASIGGLGTEAIKFASARGGLVTALSRSEAKRDKCLALGALEYHACLGDPEKMKALSGKFDVIIDTCPANDGDVGKYMDMLKFDGVYCRVGIPPATEQEFKFNYIPLIFCEKKIAGSTVTGTYRMKRMFELVASQPDKFTVEPEDWKVKTVKFDQVNEVMRDLVEGKNTNNYRYVLQW